MQGTQIQATMFNEAARKFYDKFQLGKVYYISKGTLRVANKQFRTVQNDYEMALNENSEVEEASNEAAFIPETKFNFVPIDQLGPYVNSTELVGKNPLLAIHYGCTSPFHVLLTSSSTCFRCCWSRSKCFSNNEHPKKE